MFKNDQKIEIEPKQVTLSKPEVREVVRGIFMDGVRDIIKEMESNNPALSSEPAH